MPDARNAGPVEAREDIAPVSRAERWTGTGLCPEAQADGVPCHGIDGECERCGRALPRAREAEPSG